MRIGTRGYIDFIKTSLAAPADRLNTLYTQLSSAKRLQRLSDDPLAASRAVRSHAALTELNARRFVIQDGKALLGAADSALGEMSQSLDRCHTLSLQATSPSLGQSERDDLAQEVRYVISSLVASGNQEVHDNYIFSGSKTSTIPFEEVQGGSLPVIYHGNDQQRSYMINPAENVPVGFSGAEVFNFPDASGQRPLAGVATDVFSLLQNLADSIERGDTNQVNSLGQQVSLCYQHVVGLRGRMGVMSQRYDQALTTVEATDTRLRELLNNYEDLDYAGALVDLSKEQTIYQATLAATSKLMQLPSLFDML